MLAAMSIRIFHIKIAEPFVSACTANYNAINKIVIHLFLCDNIRYSITIIDIPIAIIESVAFISDFTQHTGNRVFIICGSR